jgi:hypothetical protein
MPTYVRKKGSDTWHWCKNCSNYPTGPDVDSIITPGRPSYGELDNECKDKEKDGTCQL